MTMRTRVTKVPTLTRVTRETWVSTVTMVLG